NVLPERLAQRLAEDARHGVGRAAGREIDDQRDRTAGIILRGRCKRRRHRRGRSAAQQRDELAPPPVQHFPPPPSPPPALPPPPPSACRAVSLPRGGQRVSGTDLNFNSLQRGPSRATYCQSFTAVMALPTCNGVRRSLSALSARSAVSRSCPALVCAESSNHL